jgi:hypothetical protein
MSPGHFALAAQRTSRFASPSACAGFPYSRPRFRGTAASGPRPLGAARDLSIGIAEVPVTGQDIVPGPKIPTPAGKARQASVNSPGRPLPRPGHAAIRQRQPNRPRPVRTPADHMPAAANPSSFHSAAKIDPLPAPIPASHAADRTGHPGSRRRLPGSCTPPHLADLLARGEPTGSNETVTTTWRIALEQLQQAAPGAVGPLPLLLQSRPGLADQLEPAVAPVLTPLLEDELAAKDTITALRRYSLLTPAGGGSMSVHRWSRRSPPIRCPPSLPQPGSRLPQR